MTSYVSRAAAAILISMGAIGSAIAHVPYMEKGDFSPENPFRVKNIPQSKADAHLPAHQYSVLQRVP